MNLYITLMASGMVLFCFGVLDWFYKHKVQVIDQSTNVERIYIDPDTGHPIRLVYSHRINPKTIYKLTKVKR